VVSDFETMCWADYGLADGKARMGKTSEAIEHAEKALSAIDGRGRLISEAIALNHYGFVLLQSSDYSGALEMLEKSRRIIEKRFLFFEYMVHTYPRIAESVLGPDWQTPPENRELRRAKGACRMASLFGWRFLNVRPSALRARGRLLTALGRPAKARKSFDRSIKCARKTGAEYELARALLDLAVVSDDRAAAARSEAISILRRIGAVIPYAEKWQLGTDADESCIAPPPSQADERITPP
jgi:tetratricopeptide (TPR) repeat protein